MDVADVAYVHGQHADEAVTELMVLGEHAFPTTILDGEEVPEAWSYDQKTLPHLQAKLEQLFPKAVAAPPAGDRDPPERTLMGESWADMPLDMAEASHDDISRGESGECLRSQLVVEINMMEWEDTHGVGGALVVPPDELPSDTPLPASYGGDEHEWRQHRRL